MLTLKDGQTCVWCPISWENYIRKRSWKKRIKRHIAPTSSTLLLLQQLLFQLLDVLLQFSVLHQEFLLFFDTGLRNYNKDNPSEPQELLKGDKLHTFRNKSIPICVFLCEHASYRLFPSTAGLAAWDTRWAGRPRLLAVPTSAKDCGLTSWLKNELKT